MLFRYNTIRIDKTPTTVVPENGLLEIFSYSSFKVYCVISNSFHSFNVLSKKKRNFVETSQRCLLIYWGMFQPHSCDCNISKNVHTKFGACTSKDVEVSSELFL